MCIRSSICKQSYAGKLDSFSNQALQDAQQTVPWFSCAKKTAIWGYMPSCPACAGKSVQNAYTGRQLRIDTSGIRHGLNGGVNRLITNARLGAVIGDVVQNAVPVNALYNKAKDVMGTYAMAAYANDSRNREFAAIVTVEQRSGNVSGLESYDVTHAVSGRQKNSSQADTKSQGGYPIKAAKISIADFLSIVNSTHQSVLSDDVLQHFRESRNPNGDYSGRWNSHRANLEKRCVMA